MDGKFLKRDSVTGPVRASSRPVSACRQMASDIVKQYIVTLSQFFTLSDIALVATPSSASPNMGTVVPGFVPAGTTVLAAVYFAERMANELSECATELMAIDVGKETTQSTKGMLDSLRWRMLEVVGATWARGEVLY